MSRHHRSDRGGKQSACHHEEWRYLIPGLCADIQVSFIQLTKLSSIPSSQSLDFFLSFLIMKGYKILSNYFSGPIEMVPYTLNVVLLRLIF